jgi:hypothetical protein
MVLRDGVLSRWITGRSIKRAYRSLAGHAALELASHFFRAALFQRIGTPTRDKRERAEDRQGFHLLMLRSDRTNARRVEAMKDERRKRRRVERMK